MFWNYHHFLAIRTYVYLKHSQQIYSINPGIGSGKIKSAKTLWCAFDISSLNNFILTGKAKIYSFLNFNNIFSSFNNSFLIVAPLLFLLLANSYRVALCYFQKLYRLLYKIQQEVDHRKNLWYVQI